MAEKLEFSTQRERPTIKIDGKAYELVYPEDLQLRDALWLEKAAPKIDRLAKRMREEEFDDEVAGDLGTLILRFSDIIMGEVPAEVRAKLADMQKLSVIMAYMKLMEGRKGGEGFFVGAGDGTSLSPGSEGSTAGGPTTGAG